MADRVCTLRPDGGSICRQWLTGFAPFALTVEASAAPLVGLKTLSYQGIWADRSRTNKTLSYQPIWADRSDTNETAQNPVIPRVLSDSTFVWLREGYETVKKRLKWYICTKYKNQPDPKTSRFQFIFQPDPKTSRILPTLASLRSSNCSIF